MAYAPFIDWRISDWIAKVQALLASIIDDPAPTPKPAVRYARPTKAQLLKPHVYRGGMTRRQLRAFREQSGCQKPAKVGAWLVDQLIVQKVLPKKAERWSREKKAAFVRFYFHRSTQTA